MPNFRSIWYVQVISAPTLIGRCSSLYLNTYSHVIGSLRCDCREQLEHTLEFLKVNRLGIIIYLQQEGRGIGLGMFLVLRLFFFFFQQVDFSCSK
jgi:hypothetical protein